MTLKLRGILLAWTKWVIGQMKSLASFLEGLMSKLTRKEWLCLVPKNLQYLKVTFWLFLCHSIGEMLELSPLLGNKEAVALAIHLLALHLWNLTIRLLSHKKNFRDCLLNKLLIAQIQSIVIMITWDVKEASSMRFFTSLKIFHFWRNLHTLTKKVMNSNVILTKFLQVSTYMLNQLVAKISSQLLINSNLLYKKALLVLL